MSDLISLEALWLAAVEKIDERPSADAPDTNVGDMISRKQAVEAMGEEPMVWNDDDAFALGERNQWERDVEALRELPSAEPERKKGKWLMNGERYGHMYWRCSQCGEEVDYIGANFCSNCGSYNGGEEDG